MSLVAAALALWTAAAPPPPVLTAPNHTETDWRAAEAIALGHYRERGHTHVEVAERFPRWPFLFRLFVDESWRAYELVSRGRVVAERGVVALGQHLDLDGVFTGTPVSASELLDIIHVFDAWPPVSGIPGYPDPTAYAAGGELDAELPPPELQREPGALRVVLHYRLLEPRHSEDLFGDGPPDGPRLMEVGRWELLLRFKKAPVWTETRSSRVRR
jgi:hypothetical protein